MKNKIKGILIKKLNAIHVEVLDKSNEHAEHPEAQKSSGGHYSVLIVSDQFQWKSLIERHRMVYEALASLKNEIHALAIKALTKKEWEMK